MSVKEELTLILHATFSVIQVSGVSINQNVGRGHYVLGIMYKNEIIH